MQRIMYVMFVQQKLFKFSDPSWVFCGKDSPGSASEDTPFLSLLKALQYLVLRLESSLYKNESARALHNAP